MDLCHITVYDALRVGQYVDKSSLRGLEEFVEDIPTSMEVMPKYKFLQLNFLQGTPSRLAMR